LRFYHFLAYPSEELRADEIGSHSLELPSCVVSKLFGTLDNPNIFRESSLEIIDHRHGTRRQWALLRENEPVIPAKAGIQPDESAFPKVC
jgi:hypothetical protein